MNAPMVQRPVPVARSNACSPKQARRVVNQRVGGEAGGNARAAINYESGSSPVRGFRAVGRSLLRRRMISSCVWELRNCAARVRGELGGSPAQRAHLCAGRRSCDCTYGRAVSGAREGFRITEPAPIGDSRAGTPLHTPRAKCYCTNKRGIHLAPQELRELALCAAYGASSES